MKLKGRADKTVTVTKEYAIGPRMGAPDFEWGNMGDGAESLAWSILYQVLRDVSSASYYSQEFKRQVVDKFGEEWEITAGTVEAWLAEQREKERTNR